MAAGSARASSDARLTYDDRLPLQLVDTIESLMVASSESRQHQTMALILDTLAAILPVMPNVQRRAMPSVMRTAAQLAASHTRTRVMGQALAQCEQACRRHGLHDEAAILSDVVCSQSPV
ncbi:hypothetical protein GCM10020258_36230 [Sphingomonas yabuuchiae]